MTMFYYFYFCVNLKTIRLSISFLKHTTTVDGRTQHQNNYRFQVLSQLNINLLLSTFKIDFLKAKEIFHVIKVSSNKITVEDQD